LSKKLKIGFFIQRVASEKGFENVVSAHIQVPVMMMSLLLGRGHDVELITTEYGDDLVLPHCIPDGVIVHQVPYGSKQGKELVMHTGQKQGVRVTKLIQQIKALKSLGKTRNYDCFHFSGGEGIAMIGGLVSLFGSRVPIVLSLNVARFSGKFFALRKLLWSKISLVITSTEYMMNFALERASEGLIMRHGIVKSLEVNRTSLPGERTRVLFWRDPDKEENGADVALEVFSQLADKYPQYTFDFAVRPHWNKVKGLDEFCEKQKNANLYTVPYPEGITIEKLIAEAVCIVLPFRRLSVNPQLAVMESALAGVPTVTTSVESNPEIFGDNKRSWTVTPGDIEATRVAVESVLKDPFSAFQISENERSQMLARWCWDNVPIELEQVYNKVIKQRSLAS